MNFTDPPVRGGKKGGAGGKGLGWIITHRCSREKLKRGGQKEVALKSRVLFFARKGIEGGW